MLPAAILLSVLQAAVPAPPVFQADEPLAEEMLGSAPEAPQLASAEPSAFTPMVLRLGAADAFGCVWGASSASYCRHQSAVLDATTPSPEGALQVYLVSSLGQTPFTTWNPACRYWHQLGACTSPASYANEEYRVWLLQQQMARDFLVQNGGLRAGREIKRAREAAAAAPRAAAGSGTVTPLGGSSPTGGGVSAGGGGSGAKPAGGGKGKI